MHHFSSKNMIPEYNLNGIILVKSAVEKYLKILVSENLKVASRVATIAKKLNSRIGVMNGNSA